MITVEIHFIMLHQTNSPERIRLRSHY